jgi:DNA-binding transcriptional regulator LsrR (DeoR family)
VTVVEHYDDKKYFAIKITILHTYARICMRNSSPRSRGDDREGGKGLTINELPQRELRTQQAAYLYARHRMSQEEIGRRLGGISQSQVSRLLARAQELGLLVTEHRFVEHLVPPNQMAQIRRVLETQKLSSTLEQFARKTGGIIPRLSVFDSGPPGAGLGASRERGKSFGRAASGRLVELLSGAKVVGVAWGSTLNFVTDGLPLIPTNANRPVIQFVPICAELVALDDPDFGSSWLAARLSHIFNGDRGIRLQLTGIPAFIPKRYNAAKARSIREYIRETASYEKIFIGPDSYVDKMDTLITSVGSASAPVRGSTAELLMAAEIDKGALQDLVVGDVGGILIPKPTLTAERKRLVDEINQMWTGLRLDRIATIAKRAASGRSRGGNIVVAFGREKVASVVQAVRMGLINELIIDHDLETALSESL